MQIWQTKLKELYDLGQYDQKQFLDEYLDIIPGKDRDSKRGRVKRQVEKFKLNSNIENSNREGMCQTCSFSNGAYIYDRTIEVAQGTMITKDIILKAHNIDPNEWEVVSFKSNFWQTQAKGGKVMELYQSKVVVKPKVTEGISFSDIDDYFNSKDWNCKPATLPFEYNDSEEYLDIDFCDTHFGLLSNRIETGSNYDIYIAKERFIQVFLDFVRRCKGRKFKLINFATLGDILHIDNYKNETTNGTRQDVDGRLSKIFNIAIDTISECLDILLQLNCPIRYTYTCGNHDTFSGYALAKCIESAYKNNPNIEFDISPLPQKIHVYGNTLVGYCHGDMNSKNLGEWLQKKYRKEYGECRFAEVHCGHLHSEAVRENCGVLIKHLPCICESSYWENSEGYHSDKGLMAFVYNEKSGLRETWFTYI